MNPVISGPFASKLAQFQPNSKKARPESLTRRGAKLVVIYVRFSTDLQRSDSCDDQERKVREHLTRLGIDPTTAKVIRDEAVSGTTSDRPGLNQLKQMLLEGAVQIVAVDELSRLTRSADAASRIEDMVYEGVRFISVHEQMDTDCGDWQMKSQILGIHNNMAVREIRHRVRRGQEGRVLSDGSAGDFGFGYESYFVDPEDANRNSRGPKPKKGIRINEAEAGVVRLVFDWFLSGRSISAIARELTDQGIDKGHRATTGGWHHEQVRRMLSNTKYIGEWRWGKTTTMKNSDGEKKQVPVSEDKVIVRNRPELRIIEQSVWDRAQQRLNVLHQKFGYKEHQEKRGPKSHYTETYPKSILGGLIYCGSCGARLHLQFGTGKKYYGCPNHRKGMCKMIARVPMERGESVLLNHLATSLTSSAEWLDDALASITECMQVLIETQPDDLAVATAERAKIQQEIKNLIDALALHGISDTVAGAIRERKTKLVDVENRLTELQLVNAAPATLPDKAELVAQLSDLTSILKEGAERCAQILRTILDKVHVHEIAIPGKKRGHIQFRFRISGSSLLSHILGKQSTVPEECASQAGEVTASEICLDITTPTAMDKLGPVVARMRADGATWKAITEATGLASANAKVAMDRHLSALKQSS